MIHSQWSQQSKKESETKEIDMALLGEVNEQDAIDMMIREARRDYRAGNYKTAHNADELIAGLRGAYEN